MELKEFVELANRNLDELSDKPDAVLHQISVEKNRMNIWTNLFIILALNLPVFISMNYMKG